MSYCQRAPFYKAILLFAFLYAVISKPYPFACDHNRAPVYFSESVGSTEGFWSWPCPSSFDYLSGKCPRRGEHVLMGEHVNQSARGVFVLETNGVSPYAQGNWR